MIPAAILVVVIAVCLIGFLFHHHWRLEQLEKDDD